MNVNIAIENIMCAQFVKLFNNKNDPLGFWFSNISQITFDFQHIKGEQLNVYFLNVYNILNVFLSLLV